MTIERIRTEILEISNAVALMLTEREMDAFYYDTDTGKMCLTDEAKERVGEHSDVLEDALWGLHQTIRATYE